MRRTVLQRSDQPVADASLSVPWVPGGAGVEKPSKYRGVSRRRTTRGPGRASEQAANDVNARDVFTGDRADADEEEIEQGARHAVLPPAGPVGDVVAQALEV